MLWLQLWLRLLMGNGKQSGICLHHFCIQNRVVCRAQVGHLVRQGLRRQSEDRRPAGKPDRGFGGPVQNAALAQHRNHLAEVLRLPGVQRRKCIQHLFNELGRSAL